MMVMCLLALMACGGRDATSPLHEASAREVGSIATDTVLAVSSDLVRVEVRDSSGQLAHGVLVQFRVPSSGNADPFKEDPFGVELVRVSDGLRLPVGGTRNVRQAVASRMTR